MVEASVQHEPSEQMLVCIQNCQDCARACTQTLAYCLAQGGRHADPTHLRLLMDCADVCHTAANFMLRRSDLHAHTCAACAAVCERCAESCAAMSEDLRMKACADTCRHCAESCGQMASHGAAAHGAAPGAPVIASAAAATATAATRSGGGAVMTRRKTH